jgi:hypothetical protein
MHNHNKDNSLYVPTPVGTGLGQIFPFSVLSAGPLVIFDYTSANA